MNRYIPLFMSSALLLGACGTTGEAGPAKNANQNVIQLSDAEPDSDTDFDTDTDRAAPTVCDDLAELYRDLGPAQLPTAHNIAGVIHILNTDSNKAIFGSYVIESALISSADPVDIQIITAAQAARDAALYAAVEEGDIATSEIVDEVNSRVDRAQAMLADAYFAACELAGSVDRIDPIPFPPSDQPHVPMGPV